MYWRPTQSIPSPPLLLSRQPMLRGQFIPRYRKAIPPTSYSDTRERVGVRAQIALLHLVTSNVPRIGMTESLWDDLYFTSKGGVTCNAVTCAKCQTASLHHIRFTVHVLMDLTIDVSLALDHDADLMGPFTICDADVEPLCVRKMIFFPTHFFRPLPSAVPDNHGDVYPSPRRHHRRGSDVDCRTIVGWLCDALAKKVGDDKFPFAMPWPTAPLADGDLLCHRHHMLN